jgi:predicted metal-binding transcription factor (methanogenesis marker protein 9)
VDKITCIAYLLYKSSKNQDIKEKAIQLLNGELSIRDLKRNNSMKAHLVIAESLLKKNKIDKNEVQLFAEEFMVIEV